MPLLQRYDIESLSSGSKHTGKKELLLHSPVATAVGPHSKFTSVWRTELSTSHLLLMIGPNVDPENLIGWRLVIGAFFLQLMCAYSNSGLFYKPIGLTNTHF